MVYYILAALSLASLLGLFAIFTWQIRDQRRKNIDYSKVSHYGITGLAIDYLAFRIVHFCQEFLFKGYLFVMHFVKNSIATVRYAIVVVEKRFNRLAANMPEPGDIHKTDKVSSFLKEIKEHKENAMEEIKNNAEEEIEK